jgi:hypothetical protein
LQRLPKQRNLPSAEGQETRKSKEQGSFAGTIGADNPHPLANFNSEIHPLQNQWATRVGDPQLANLHRWPCLHQKKTPHGSPRI